MTKKTVKAPLTYDPGKGRPKEHLAYLNWQEMEALKRLNGGNMERGPRGLPSFPPADAIGSSSRSTSRSYGSSSGSRSYGGGGRDVGGGVSSNYRGSDVAGRGAGPGGAGVAARTSAARRAEAARSEADRRNKDVQVKREAEARNAKAVRGIPALREDSRKAVEPPSADIRFRGPISGTISGLSAPQGVYGPRSMPPSTRYVSGFANSLYANPQIGTTPIASGLSRYASPSKTITDRVPAYSSSGQAQDSVRTTYQAEGLGNVMSRGPLGYARGLANEVRWQAGFGQMPTNEIVRKSAEVKNDITKAKDIYGPLAPRAPVSIREREPLDPSIVQTGGRGRTALGGAQWRGVSGSPISAPSSAAGPVMVSGSGTVTPVGGRPERLQHLSDEDYYDYMTKQTLRRESDEDMPLSQSDETRAKVAGGIQKAVTMNPLADIGLGIGQLAGTALEKVPIGGVSKFGSDLKRMFGTLRDPAGAVREYARMDPLQREELLRRVGDVNRFAEDSSRSGGPFGSGSGSGAVAVSGGGGADSGGGRPYVYYQWDVGVNVPSPGDPLYTQYQEYLKTKEEAPSA